MSDLREKIRNATPEERLVLEKILGAEILEAVGLEVETAPANPAPKSSGYVFQGNEVRGPIVEDADTSAEPFVPEPVKDIWHVTALNLPQWMTDSSVKDSARLTIRRRAGYEEVLTPDHQQIVLVTESGSHMQPLLYQDVLAFRSWRQRGGPRWKKGLGINLHAGERMRICPYGDAGTPEALEYEQPWVEPPRKNVAPVVAQPADYEERVGGSYRTPPKVAK